MVLKYAEHCGRMPSCPPPQARPCALDAYRFVHNPITDERNYQPPAIIKPSRFLAKPACDAYALSFYTTQEAASAAFASLSKTNRLIHKAIGSHLARVALAEEDGLATDPDAEFHFDLYESQEADFADRLLIIGPLNA